MSPTCRRAAALTSGYHPEPDPDIPTPGDPDLCAPDGRTSSPAFPGHSALAALAPRASLSEGGAGMPVTPGGLKAPGRRLSAKQGV